jgi:hypothetical protein
MTDLHPDSTLDRRKGWAPTKASCVLLRFSRTDGTRLVRWKVWVPAIGGGIVSFISPSRLGRS